MKQPARLDAPQDSDASFDWDQLLGVVETGIRKVRSVQAVATTVSDPTGRVLVVLGIAAKLAHAINLPEAVFSALAAQAFRSGGSEHG